jgi:hypothetical protein
LHFEAAIAIESDSTCRNFLQSYWKIPTIHEKLDQSISYLASESKTLAIQGYYASISEELDSTQHKAFFAQQYTLFDLLRTGSQLQVAIFEYRDNIDNKLMATFEKKLQSNKWTTTQQTINFETHSDRVGGSVKLLFAFNSDFYTSPVHSDCHI